MSNILLTKDYGIYSQYDRLTLKKYCYKYSDLIKREQKFLGNLLRTKYSKTKPEPELVVIVYIHSNFGKRAEEDYKVVRKGSLDYFKFINTDDWDEVGTFNELKNNLT